MNILFFTENFPPETNAAATRVYERAVYWAKWGHQVTVITCQPNFPHGRLFDGYENSYSTEDMDGLRVVRVPTYISPNRGVFLRILDFLSFMISGYRAARLEPAPDVVISTSPQFFAAVAAWWFAKRRGLRYVFELGDLWPASIAAVGAMKANLALRLLEKLELKMYRDADAVVALTSSFRNNLIDRGIDAGKIAVVINGVDLWRYAPRPRDTVLAARAGLKDGECVIGYIGTHGMAHALDNVLDTAAIMRERPDIVFLLVGAGAERDGLMARAKAERLTNVRFLDPQPKASMPDVWSLCDAALVHLKNADVFAGVIPSKIFEAMGMGLPIIFAGPPGEGSGIVANAGAGLIVAAQNPHALASACAVLADEPDQRRDMGKRSLTAAPRYSRETQSRHMIDVLDAVIAGRGMEAARINPGRGEAS
ncbi:glycosyltransferase family 4 protein [Thalassospiraceae bacterium LMO-JJ14]|nr:glycosyltransferase family 4 protein [Thalassospiraceae bacterium LMO-JJ14]